MTIPLDVPAEEQELMESYAKAHGMTVSEVLRKAFILMAEDEIDSEHCARSIEQYEKSKIAYSLDELEDC